MDAGRINPISDVVNKVQQHAHQVRNVQAGMGGLKHSKELDVNKALKSVKPKRPKNVGNVNNEEDLVQIRHEEEIDEEEIADAGMDAAAHSGVLSSLKKSEQKKHSMEMTGMEYSGFSDQDNEPTENIQQSKNSEKTRVLMEAWDSQELTQAKLDFIKGDVPVEAYEAAKKMVEGQIDIKTGKPANSLAQLKNVGKPQEMQMEPAESLSIMDIHDTANKPILIEEEEEEEERRRRKQPTSNEEEEESKS